MERKEFISKLALSLGAVCAGCGLASCGSTPKSEEPQPNTGNNATPGTPLFTVDLNNDLQSVGAFKIASGVILVRLTADDTPSAFTAVQVACTHQGTYIGYNNAQARFICPAHGSEFSNSGAVLQGPATIPLKQYNILINGNMLTVTT